MPTVTERIITLLRHGETTGGSGFRGRSDDALTALGWQQMQTAVADGGNWDAIVSSPLRRCADFAQWLGDAHHIRVHYDAKLQELDFGRWEGRTAAELMQSDAGALGAFWNDPYHNPPPDGEALHAFEQRVLSAWQEIATLEHRRILLITHAGVIRMLLCHLHNAPHSQLLQFDVAHASLHRVAISQNGNWQVAPTITTSKS